MIPHLRQFRPSLYILLTLGITGYALAAEVPGLWVAAMAAIALNAWLVASGRFVPLPRLIATAATFLALIHGAMQIMKGEPAPILAIGNFLVLLHLVKLYEQRANRDYAQLLVLSLLLMTAAAISTASLVFGLMLLLYLVMSLYCCLLFHLKVESDAAEVMLVQAIPPSLRTQRRALLPRDGQSLSASVRRLTGLVAGISISVAIVIFLFFPRGAPEGFLGRQFLRPPQSLAGFSEQVSMDQVAAISQSEQVVAEARVTERGKPWEGENILLLRGATLDRYTGPPRQTAEPEQRGPAPWSWLRTSSDDVWPFHGAPGTDNPVPEAERTFAPYVQEITLHPTNSHVLFAIGGVQSLQSSQDLTLNYLRRDAVLTNMAPEPLAEGGALVYTIRSTGTLPVMAGDPVGIGSYIDPVLAAYARRPDVSGVDESGRSLAALRGTPAAPPDIDHRIATAIERHLRTQPFQYTLDLSPYAMLHGEKDPLVVFLTEQKKGHCEYFAGAMTLLCQSLGMQARMVVGYRCDNFNAIGHFYIVQQNQAHAWVEVATEGVGPSPGRRTWETFDPTSPNDAGASQTAGMFSQMRSLFNYLEYRWGTAVIAYGQQNRENILASINQDTSHAAVSLSQALPKLPRWMSGEIVSPTPIGVLVTLAFAALIAAVGYYLREQMRLRRRRSRIGLARLPLAEQKRLSRQLGFYDDLLRLLEKRGITPRADLTPLEFSDQLAYLPNELYHDVRRLTRLFYRIRYGGAVLSAARRRRLDSAIARIGRIIQSLRRHKIAARR